MDLDLNLKLQPAKYRQLLQHILQHVADGNLPVLPVSEFGLRDAADAFRLMASGKHTGKIVISIPDSGSIEAVASPPPVPLVSPDGGYLIVGGMGGLGFVVARWLAEQGAGLVVLNGRSAPDDEVGAAIAELNAAGHRIEVVTGDIAEPATADRLVQAVEDAGFRLAGVLHSAMVLADEIVLNMTDSAAARVFAPRSPAAGCCTGQPLLVTSTGGSPSPRPPRCSAHPGRAPTPPRTPGSTHWSRTGVPVDCPRSESTGAHGPRLAAPSSSPIWACR
ncbi:short chain dehydrogenase family protein [Mycobacterium kansasii 824]|nr:short chain dehydrogenase family protein [Mycobacterium kansasii 824]